jgi:diguanylate cyclase (GGDEF)-like protein
MSRACPPPNEAERLATLRAYGILDTPPEPSFDAITRIAAHVCETPIALISFVEDHRQWFKSGTGLGVRETPLEMSVCAHAILQREPLVVPDTRLDPRFRDNPLVCGEPHMRFYAGAVLETEDGHALGTLCVLDVRPRTLSAEQTDILRALAGQVMALLQLYRQNHLQARMLAEIDAARREMTLLASTDVLTGLVNRRAFSDRLNREIARIARGRGPSCLIMADLDHFKTINDRYGHHTGDHALTVFAATCNSVFREADLIGRWGGEEFIVLLPDTTLSDALRVADRLHTALARTPINGQGESFHLSVSLGVTELDGSRGIDEVLRAADEALYAAKEAGRNRTEAG